MLLLAPLLLFLQDSPAARTERDVVYRKVAAVEAQNGAHEELQLDAYLPADDGLHPALLLVHGGAWIHGGRGDMRTFGELYAKAGYACFSLDYRLAPRARWPAQIDDCLYAVQWVRSQAARYRVDPTRVGALGLSAGGHLVALLGVLDERRDAQASDPVLRESSRVQCVVDYFGPVLLTRTKAHDDDLQPPPELFGEVPDAARFDALLAGASPLTLVSADDAPFLIVHGDADEIVPVQQSRRMDEALRAQHVPSELLVIPGGGHGDFFFEDPEGAYWAHSAAFLREHLGQAKPASPVH